ncbi:alpha-L-rhamnosidase N-terminal domain-containing protein [Pedobacter sp. SYP-B3415]|uniref:alpha-L-rhamnosidase N-terminal domain-containing protein n=1 Tax=Pedobacter sp. SYP-B3415 TaxID=2496641 RepID=UPI00101D0094|nr:alpha-L-rhamnosidase N-terminal domain-containing protein [Pedobacter sp. SYP-B3415]
MPKFSLRFSLLFLAIIFIAGRVHSQKLAVYDLKINQLTNSLSTDLQNLNFSWKLKSSQKNTTQVQYELNLLSDGGSGARKVWSVKSPTDQSVAVRYAGDPLRSNAGYFWQVRVRDNHGNTSAWSERQHFRTAMLPQDWKAKWIGVSGSDTSAVSPVMRKKFMLNKSVRTAYATITAKGLYEARLNGSRISDHYFAPGWTSYKHHIQYQVYKLDKQLKKGENVIGVTLADGWYKGRIGFANQSKFYGDTRALKFQLDLEYIDGSRETIISDESWKSTGGPIRSSDIYDGETYDAREELPGWDDISFSESERWQPVQVLQPGSERLVGMSGPPVRKHETFKPLKIFRTPAGEHVIDFGQNLVGWVVLQRRTTRLSNPLLRITGRGVSAPRPNTNYEYRYTTIAIQQHASAKVRASELILKAFLGQHIL